MLPPWCKLFSHAPTRTLAVTPQGIALRMPNQPAQMLTDANTPLATTAQLNAHWHTLFSQQPRLRHHALRVVLSNAYVRYLVVPWQSNLYRLQDWEALAQHLFRQQFGAMASDWQVRVHLGDYGQPVLAAAVDRGLLEPLISSAQTSGVALTTIEPAFLRVLKQQPEQRSWTMMVEPTRVLLMQAHHGVWQNISMDAPPAGYECQHAQQMVSRALLRVEANQYPTKVITHVSAALQSQWHTDAASICRLAHRSNGTQPHAAWLAGI